MIDLFVPTYRPDRRQLDVLLHSLRTYAAPSTFRSITLAAVDAPSYLDELRQVPADRHLGLRDLGLESVHDGYKRGWLLQQAAKLAFARHATAEFFCILDSKNIALRPFGPDDLVRDGRGAQVHEPITQHIPWWKGSMWALGHKRFDLRPGRMYLSSATPVVMHTATARAMVDELERRHRRPLDRLFLQPRILRRPTEFTLYGVYVDREGLTDRVHFRHDQLLDDTVIWGSYSDEKRRARLDRMLARDTSALFTGIARPVWESMAAREQNLLVDTLVAMPAQRLAIDLRPSG